ncbi:MAG: hypothetical protein AAFQ13_04190, partial [Pseudomonadota bacterium]
NGTAVKVRGRGREAWVHRRHLDGEALLEVYVMDVGQGDGLLVVTPEGHNIMVDGGNIRKNQNGGTNAADFVDWKFFRDYTSEADRSDPDKSNIALDVMVASHNDLDHFGGLWDLIDQDEKNRSELDAEKVSVDQFYHAGLSWWFNGYEKPAEKKGAKRTLGPVKRGHYTKILTNRASAKAATEKLDDPDFDTLSGSWGKFIKAVTLTKTAAGGTTPVKRLSNRTHDFLPGFEINDPGQKKCAIRVLGPIEGEVDQSPALIRYPDGTSKNTNGHSVILRLDYGDRRIMLTGDLNTHSQNHIMSTYGTDFIPEFKCDVAKGCHHGSHDVSYKFLEGMRPVATVISSGDAETHDHPRPNIVSASAITGRKLIENDRMISPLIYMTEVARSVSIAEIGQMNEFATPQPKFSRKRPTGAKKIHNTEDEMAHFHLMLGSSQSSPKHWPRLDQAKAVRGLRYGLINVRTDGKRLLFAQLEESGGDWAVHTLSSKQISEAR